MPLRLIHMDGMQLCCFIRCCCLMCAFNGTWNVTVTFQTCRLEYYNQMHPLTQALATTAFSSLNHLPPWRVLYASCVVHGGAHLTLDATAPHLARGLG